MMVMVMVVMMVSSLSWGRGLMEEVRRDRTMQGAESSSFFFRFVAMMVVAA